MGKKYQTFARREKRQPAHPHLWAPASGDYRPVPTRRRIIKLTTIQTYRCPYACDRVWENVRDSDIETRQAINDHFMMCKEKAITE